MQDFKGKCELQPLINGKLKDHMISLHLFICGAEIIINTFHPILGYIGTKPVLNIFMWNAIKTWGNVRMLNETKESEALR